MEEFLKKEYYENSIQNYLIAVGIILGGLLLLRLFRKSLLDRLRKWASTTETKFDDYLVSGVAKFGLPILNFVVIYIALRYLTLPERITHLVHNAWVVIFSFYAVRLLSSTIRLSLETFTRAHHGEEKLKQLNGIMLIVNAIMWAIGLLFVFNNLGYDVTAIVAGLGIGGIAIALAAQNILGDLFNYFVIFFDRPFEVGDFITVDDKKGTVEYIGIKTSRLKSITGEQLVFSNSDLTKSRIHNFKRMDRRRILFSLGVVYQTPPELLEKIPTLLKDIVMAQPSVTFDRAHFAKFGASSLDFEVVYFVETSEYTQYMDLQQKINLQIFHAFAAEKIEFAYPTQTLFLTREKKEENKNED
jgi:small-conductance mechanosensitive channel